MFALLGLLGFGLLGGDAFGIGLVHELDETCVDLVEGRLVRTHAQGPRFLHQGVELRLDGKRILLRGKVVGLLDERVPLACEERCGLPAAVFGFPLDAEFFGGNFTDGGMLGVLGAVCERCFGLDAIDGGLRDVFLCVPVGGEDEYVHLAGLLDEFETELGARQRLGEFVGVARVLQFVDKAERLFVCGFTEILELLGDLFEVAGFGQAADAGLAVLLRNCSERRDKRQLLYGCGPYATIIIGKGDSFQGALFARVHLGDGLQALLGVGILPFRFKCVQ